MDLPSQGSRSGDTHGSAWVPVDPAASQPGFIARMHLVADRLEAGLGRIDDRFAARWQAHMTEIFAVAVGQPRSADSVAWNIDLAARSIVAGEWQAGQPFDAHGKGEDACWSIAGSTRAWHDVLTGRLNLGVALRRGELRYADSGGNDVSVAEIRIAMLAALLGLALDG